MYCVCWCDLDPIQGQGQGHGAFELPTTSEAVHAGGDDRSPLAGLSGFVWDLVSTCLCEREGATSLSRWFVDKEMMRSNGWVIPLGGIRKSIRPHTKFCTSLLSGSVSYSAELCLAGTWFLTSVRVCVCSADTCRALLCRVPSLASHTQLHAGREPCGIHQGQSENKGVLQFIQVNSRTMRFC